MAEATEAGIFEIMYSTRAMRRLKPDPIPEETLKKIIDAGIRGAQRRQYAGLGVYPGPRDTERETFYPRLLLEYLAEAHGRARHS